MVVSCVDPSMCSNVWTSIEVVQFWSCNMLLTELVTVHGGDDDDDDDDDDDGVVLC